VEPFVDLLDMPKDLGFDAERLRRADALIARGVEDRLYTAAVYAILRHGRIAAYGAFGHPQPDVEQPQPTTIDTIFDMASISKTITATLLLHCVEDGRVHLKQLVQVHLPEALDTPVGKLTLFQLVTHTSGLPPWKAVDEAATPLAAIMGATLDAEPGSQYAYSDLGYILLGIILERILQSTIDVLAQEMIFAPLGMTRTCYNPLVSLPVSLQSAIAATAHGETAKSEPSVGLVHDPNARSMGGAAGHAGLFSCAPDMVRFSLALMYPEQAVQRGLPALLGPLARRLATERQTDPAVGGHSIGWFTVPNGYLPRGDLLSERTFGHSGFTGTLLMHDPQTSSTVLLLTNRVYYAAENDGSAFLRMRPLLANLVASAIR